MIEIFEKIENGLQLLAAFTKKQNPSYICDSVLNTLQFFKIIFKSISEKTVSFYITEKKSL